MQDTVLVSWTNFLAMVENGHKGWDLWEKSGGKGAVPTKDAAKAPTRTDEEVRDLALRVHLDFYWGRAASFAVTVTQADTTLR